ncbi:MAG: helix-turn-helix transcriptional regulator [Lachnospiraceae bacterium]|nr:helix-turn-helix transcriptional regulator [Lachnospiraceae bacterium]
MDEMELRKTIGKRALQRRKELNLSQKYIAEKLGVNTSTVLRYEKGTSDNTKFYILEGLSNALDVSVDWLKGETDDMHTQNSDTQELQINDMIGVILRNFPKDMEKDDEEFCKNILLLFLKEYNDFMGNFAHAVKYYSAEADNSSVVGAINGIMPNENMTNDDFNRMCYIQDITPMINELNNTADMLKEYDRNPKEMQAEMRSYLGWFKGRKDE